MRVAISSSQCVFSLSLISRLSSRSSVDRSLINATGRIRSKINDKCSAFSQRRSPMSKKFASSNQVQVTFDIPKDVLQQLQLFTRENSALLMNLGIRAIQFAGQTELLVDQPNPYKMKFNGYFHSRNPFELDVSSSTDRSQ